MIPTDALAKHKMAFISGPRQVGKSTLAKQLIHTKENYFLYDHDDFRIAWAKSPDKAISSRGPGPIVLDELHKDRKWKLHLKGIYDRLADELPIIVTGSARLEVYRRGSDSLLGRYLPYRLHPFSVAEDIMPVAVAEVFNHEKRKFDWHSLLTLGGFPEPLLGGSELEAHRWSRLRLDRVVSEDTRDFLNISDLQAFRNLVALLPERVGSLLSVEALRGDVGKAYGTVRSWMQVLDTLYYCFTIKPFGKKLSRAIQSQPKLYLFDILRIPKQLEAKRLENLTALHLLKACHFWTDTAQGEFELRFIRSKDGREVDFVIISDDAPWMLIECKSSDKQPSKDLLYYTELLKPKWSIQLVQEKNFDRFFADPKIRVVNYEKFFSGLL
jgi:predicted AAA+ superfamily ATPase